MFLVTRKWHGEYLRKVRDEYNKIISDMEHTQEERILRLTQVIEELKAKGLQTEKLQRCDQGHAPVLFSENLRVCPACHYSEIRLDDYWKSRAMNIIKALAEDPARVDDMYFVEVSK